MGGGGGKGGGGGSFQQAEAGQVSPEEIAASQAAWQQAADVIAAEFPAALKAFENQLGAGYRVALEDYSNAQIATMPFSDAAVESVNELRMFLGLDPFSETQMMAQQVQAMADEIYAFPSTRESDYALADQISGMANQLRDADAITDPAQREAMKAQLGAQIAELQSQVQQEGVPKAWSETVHHPAVAAQTIPGTPGPGGTANRQGLSDPELFARYRTWKNTQVGGGPSPQLVPDSQGGYSWYGNQASSIRDFDIENVKQPSQFTAHYGPTFMQDQYKNATYSSKVQAYEVARKRAMGHGGRSNYVDRNNEMFMFEMWKNEYLKGGSPGTPDQVIPGSPAYDTVENFQEEFTQGHRQLRNIASRLTGISSDFEREYGLEKERGYTGAEIQAQLEATPGYQFQLNQGNQAIQRAQAASGMLGSGNTLAAAQEYGQGLASQVYGAHVQRLAGLAGLNIPVAQQGVQTSLQTGNVGLATGTTLGQAGQATLQDIAKTRAGVFEKGGDALLNAAFLNAQLKTQASTANAQASAQLAAAQSQNGGGYGIGRIFGALSGGLL